MTERPTIKRHGRGRRRRSLPMVTTPPAQAPDWEKLLNPQPLQQPTQRAVEDLAVVRIMERASPGALLVRRLSEIMLASPYVSPEGKQGWALIRAASIVYAGYKFGEQLSQGR